MSMLKANVQAKGKFHAPTSKHVWTMSKYAWAQSFIYQMRVDNKNTQQLMLGVPFGVLF